MNQWNADTFLWQVSVLSLQDELTFVTLTTESWQCFPPYSRRQPKPREHGPTLYSCVEAHTARVSSTAHQQTTDLQSARNSSVLFMLLLLLVHHGMLHLYQVQSQLEHVICVKGNSEARHLGAAGLQVQGRKVTKLRDVCNFTYEIRTAFHDYLESLIQRARRQAKAVRTTENGGAQSDPWDEALQQVCLKRTQRGQWPGKKNRTWLILQKLLKPKYLPESVYTPANIAGLLVNPK